MSFVNAIYEGHVEHRRLRPVTHALSYKVFALWFDLDHLPQGLRLFSINRFNLFSLYERDHGVRDGRPLKDYVRDLIATHPQAAKVARICLLAYPRVLGFVFNPLSTYYCFDSEGRLLLMVYEVTNTYGDRTSYVLPVEEGVLAQACAKRMWVSPFNAVEGEYGFHGNVPGESLSLGVCLRDGAGPKLKAWFSAKRRPLSDGELVRQFARVPFLTFKVVLGIGWEALKLRLKGLAYVRRPAPPAAVFHSSRARNP